MPTYVLAYHGGGMAETPEAQEAEMAKWGAWFETLGPAVVDGGAPTSLAKTVSAGGVADGGGANPISGYSLITADNLDAAVDAAQGCPILANGGSVEVAETVDM